MRQGFDKIIGQDLAKRVLARAVHENKPSHTYLFLGLEGTGKMTTAVEFAKALNCNNSHEGNACEACSICRSIEHYNCSEVRIWSPEVKKQDTTIDQMREMRDYAMLRPVSARWKVNIIEQGDTLNDESANCILKLLEEPPDYVVNVLLFRNSVNILPTIRSRCRIVRFTQVSTVELIERLLEEYNVTNDKARFLAVYSQGCPGKAIRLIDDEGFFQRRDSVIEIVGQVFSGNPWSALKLAEVLRSEACMSIQDSEYDEELDESIEREQSKRSTRDVLLESLDIMLLWYRDLLATKLIGTSAAVVNVDKQDEISAHAVCYPDTEGLFDAVETILEAKRLVLANCNAQIVTEALIMQLASCNRTK